MGFKEFIRKLTRQFFGTRVSKYYLGSLKVDNKELTFLSNFYKVSKKEAVRNFREDFKELRELEKTYRDIRRTINNVTSLNERRAEVEELEKIRARKEEREPKNLISLYGVYASNLEIELSMSNDKFKKLEQRKRILGIELKQKYESLLNLEELLSEEVNDSELASKIKSDIIDSYGTIYSEVKNLPSLR